MRLMSIQKSTLSRGQFNFIMRKLEEILDEILSKRINHVRLILNICSLLKNLKNIQSKKAKIKDMFEFAEKCQLLPTTKNTLHDHKIALYPQILEGVQLQSFLETEIKRIISIPSEEQKSHTFYSFQTILLWKKHIFYNASKECQP